MKLIQLTTSAMLGVGLLTGCSTIKNNLPDKERDYQFAREIAPLKIPPDLANNAVQTRVVYEEVEPEPKNIFVIADEPVDLPTEVEPEEDTTTEFLERPNPAISLVQPHIARLNTDFNLAWRMVNKALTRKMLEVTTRNQTEKYFQVQYDPHAKDFKDETVADEIEFLLGEAPSQEKPYYIQLISQDLHTDIHILDVDKQKLASGVGLDLLDLIYTTIQTDLNQKNSD